MGALIGAHDWSKTSLGPISDWSQSLRTTVGLLLRSPVPMVLLWGPDGVMLYNDAYSIVAGGRHPHLLGSKVREGWPEVADFNDNVMKVGLSGGTLSYRDQELTLYRKGGPEQVWMNLDYSPVLDESGQPAGVLAVVVETTDRVLAERALKKAEERLSYALDASGMVGTFDWHIQTDTFYSDPRFAAMYSVDPSKARIGAPIADYFAGIHPDDRERIGVAVNHTIATGEKYTQEYRLLHKDGTVRWIEARGECLYDENGKPLRFPGAVVDITDRKEAEEVERRLAAIIQSSDDAILSVSLGGTITSWNQGAERLYGYRAEEVIGKPVTVLLPEDRQDEEPGILERISRGEHVHHYETIRQRKDGSLVEISLTVSPIRDAHGKVIGASKIARDITERKQAERLQRVLMHELNHRVKNTLAMVQAIARQTFHGSQEGSAAREAFDARLLAMSNTHDLLMRENWDGAELSKVIAEVIAPYQRERFEINGPELRLTPRVALSLTMALHELTTNAAKYGALSVPTGRVAITWTVRPGDPPHLIFRWQERSGPPVSPPTKKGFGSRLIERSLATELAGEVHLSYASTGVVCEVSAPLADERKIGVEEAA